MKFLANENIPKKVCNRLRLEMDIDITSSLEIAQGLRDEEVISLAQEKGSIIITFDKDFGELVFKKRANVKGIVLLRFAPVSPEFIFNKIKNLLLTGDIKLEGNFVVVEEDLVRVREIK